MKSHPNPFNNTSHNFCLITLILVCFYIESVYSQSLPSYIDAVIENACLNDGSITINLIDPPFQVVEYFWYEGNLQGQDFTPILSNFNYVQDLGQGYYTLSMLSSSGCRADIEFYVPSTEESLFTPPCIHPANSINDGGILLPYHEGYTYTWDGFSDANGPALYPVPACDYTVHIEGPEGEFPYSSEFTYTVPPCTPEDIILTPIVTIQSSDNGQQIANLAIADNLCLLAPSQLVRELIHNLK